jgi:predicted S18 family serine protease
MKRLAVLSFTIATLIAPTFSQTASGLDATQPAVEATTQPAVEATTKVRTRGSGMFNYDGTPTQPAVEATTKVRTRGSGMFNYDGTPR